MRLEKAKMKLICAVTFGILFLFGCDDPVAENPDAFVPDAAVDDDAQADVEELTDVTEVDTPAKNTTTYETNCDISVYVDLSEQGAWPFYTNWFAKFPYESLGGPIKDIVKVLMCDPHSESNDRCPPHWNCDRDEDPEHPGCVWSTHELKNDGLQVACGQEYFNLNENGFDWYRYRFTKALIEVTHDN